MSPLISLRHLRAFIAVAELGSATRAAEHLYRAQSAVTRSIHELETGLNVELFERRATGMLCTAFGNALLYRARRAMQEFELGAQEVNGKSVETQGGVKTRVPSGLLNERRLVAFIKLAESGHMPTVAKALGVSQPAVSSAINDLEESVGVALFKRTSKGMLPTDAGEQLTFRVKRALTELRHVDADLANLKGTVEGKVVIGALPLGRTFILPKAISNVLARHPRLRFSTIEGPFDTLAASLRAGDIDFIFGALRPADYARDLVGTPLLDESMAVIVRGGHPLAGKPGLTLAELANAQWVLSSIGTPARGLLNQAFASQELKPPSPAVETSDLALLRGLLLHSDMVTAISARQLEYEIGAGVLKALDVVLPNTSRVIGITQRAESHPSPGAVALMEEIRQVVLQYGA
ncbi:LysR family transcriptional regulator [Noviherbaspirillum humi]|uniref:LysR family transcriptional regulator n=1 Tax=Noviherbaspirillum humi TaxID=1688639 RepID=UPI001FE5703C|nr:LysR family transcriptional regulator [Noviherbaspirillum humi]